VNRRRILAAIISATLLALGALFSLSITAAPPPPPQDTNGLQDIDPHKAFGSKNAPVIMEIFSDYQCPSCKALFLSTNRLLMDNYVSTGKVYVIHRDFPLDIHAYSRVAARYARAAAQIGKVEAVEQAIYQNQEKWEQTGDVDGTVAAVLTSVGDDKDKMAVYLSDCRRLGIKVLPPDVNESLVNFASVGKDIRFGMGAVRNVGANVVASLINTRTDKGKFTDFSDYLNKVDIAACNKKVTESLIKAGAFDSLGHARKGLFLVHTDAVDSVLGTKKAEAMGQFDLFGGSDGEGAGDAVFTIKVPDDEWEDKHKLALEREMLGLYVSGHPLNRVAHLLSGQVDTAIPAILDGDIPNETQVRVGGILASVNRRVNKNGMPWASAQLEDLTGGIEVMFFPHAYSTFGADIVDDAVVLINAKVAIRDDRIALIVNELVVPDFSNARADRPLAVSMPTRQCTFDKVSALKQVLAQHPGTSQVHLRLVSGDRVTTLELDSSLRVTPSPALMGDLKALLGPGCLGG